MILKAVPRGMTTDLVRLSIESRLVHGHQDCLARRFVCRQIVVRNDRIGSRCISGRWQDFETGITNERPVPNFLVSHPEELNHPLPPPLCRMFFFAVPGRRGNWPWVLRGVYLPALTPMRPYKPGSKRPRPNQRFDRRRGSDPYHSKRKEGKSDREGHKLTILII